MTLRSSRLAAAFCLLLGVPGAALAQPCAPETETPETETSDEAAILRAGAFCLAGAAQGADRDTVVWTLDESAAGNLWTLALEALPGDDGRLRIARLETAPDGAVRENEVVNERVEAQTGGVALPPLLLAAGDYRLIVEGGYGNGMLYRLRAAQAAPLPAALDTAGASGAFAGLLSPAEDGRAVLPWTVDAGGRLWTVTLQTELGASPTLELLDGQGRRIVYGYSQLGGIARLADLGLEPGRYTIQVTGRTGGRLLLAAEDTGPRAPGHEAEPNGEPALADPFDPDTPIAGRLIGSGSRNDDDYLRLVLDQAWSGQRFDLVLRADSLAELRLALHDPQGRSLQERTGAGEVRLPDLALAPGEHLVRVYGALDPAVSYTLAVEGRAPLPQGQEREPNDTAATASAFTAAGVAQGRFSGRETDVFALTVEGEPELWRIEAEGSGLERLVLYDAADNTIVDDRPGSGVPGSGAAMLSGLFLVEGRHLFGVTGIDGDYRLTATRLGPPPAPGASIADVLARNLGDELEPNDDMARAMRLEPEVPRSGVLDRVGDVDLYRFHLAAASRVRLSLSGPPGSTLVADLQWGERRGPVEPLRTFGVAPARSEVQWDGVLGPGDHYLAVRADGAADGPYGLLLEQRPWFDRPIDLEPNDQWWQATPVPPDLRLIGTLFPRDSDWYRLPDLDRSATLVVHDLMPEAGTLAGTSLTIVRALPTDPSDPWPSPERETVATLYQDRDSGDWRGELPAGAGYHLGVGGSQGGPYAVALDLGEAVPAQPMEPLPVAMALALEADSVAAFATVGQSVAGSVSLENHGPVALDLDLDTHAGDERWQVVTAQRRLTLAAGQAAEVPVVVTVAPDAWDGRPVTIAVAAFADGPAPAYAEATVTPLLHADAVAPAQAWALPEAMLGGLDVAAAAAGATVQPEEPRLIDGGVNQGTSAVLTQAELRAAQPVIALAGETPVRLAGVLLTPAALPEVVDRMRRFAISVSLDGVGFERVFEGSLSARPAEQAFAFAEPVEARFLRLEPIDSHGGNRTGSGASLGEIKAVAVPDGNPLDPAGIGLNLADPARGGHVVWSTPAFDGRHLLTAEAERPRLYLGSDHDGRIEFVVGFAHNRAARVTSVEWLSGDDPAQIPLEVTVAASLGSPAGPWEELGRFDLPPAGTAGLLEGLRPHWARYLRFSFAAPPDTRQVQLPETLVIREEAVGVGYRSILGEWGDLGRDAVYEWLNPPSEGEATAADDNDAPETADPLPFDTTVSGTVLLDSDVDWYRVEVPEDGRRLLVSLAGNPAPYVVPILQDGTGAEVPLVADGTTSAGTMRYVADVAPGPYLLRIEDPPRSIALAWDTSGSVAGFIPAIVQAIRGFAEGLRPEREVVNLFPFRGDATAPLLEDWTGDPLRVFLTLHAYPWTDSSSNAEAALLAASQALAGRNGQRAIVLLTDAKSDGAGLTPQLWASLDEVRPRIFALGVPGSFTGEELWRTRNLMQDWAGINGGFYQPMLSQGEIDVAFERLAGWLRRPAAYALSVELDRTPPPPLEPGRLQLLATADAPPAQRPDAVGTGGILIILDASGSMLQRMDGVRRIEIAKQTLTELTGATIPSGTVLGLRVFGQGPPDSCETGLVVPPQPLDAAAIAGVIAGIEPTNRARTPIGESLRLVPQDMAGVDGPLLAVLITDGEETCGGDPAAEIVALRAMGIDVRVNIVGFALEDPALAATFAEWAELGGGRYFDAADAEALGEALNRAVQRRFTVENSRGRVVAEGAIGDPAVTLEPGTYTVSIDGGSSRRVVIGAGETVTLTGPF